MPGGGFTLLLQWIKRPQISNLYAYVGNDPTDKTDPTGETPAAALGVLAATGTLDAEEDAGTGFVTPVSVAAVGVTTVAGLGITAVVFFQPPSAPTSPTINEAKGDIPNTGTPGTTAANRPGTKQVRYGPDGRIEQEYNDGHSGHPPPGDKPHIHDHTPRPGAPKGTPPKRQPPRPPKPGDVTSALPPPAPPPPKPLP